MADKIIQKEFYTKQEISKDFLLEIFKKALEEHFSKVSLTEVETMGGYTLTCCLKYKIFLPLVSIRAFPRFKINGTKTQFISDIQLSFRFGDTFVILFLLGLFLFPIFFVIVALYFSHKKNSLMAFDAILKKLEFALDDL